MNRIKSLRQERGWKQSELAEKLKLMNNTVSRYETEQRQLDPETIGKLCDIFDCTADYLLGRSDVPSPDEITADEWALIRSYRELSAEGREYVRHSLALAALAHAGKNPALPELEKGG